MSSPMSTEFLRIGFQMSKFLNENPEGVVAPNSELEWVQNGSMRNVCLYLQMSSNDRCFNRLLKACENVSSARDACRLMLEDQIYIQVFVEKIVYGINKYEHSQLAALCLRNFTILEEDRRAVIDIISTRKYPSLNFILMRMISKCVSGHKPSNSCAIGIALRNLSEDFAIRTCFLHLPKEAMDPFFSLLRGSGSDDRDSIITCLRNMTFFGVQSDIFLHKMFDTNYIFYLIMPLYIGQDVCTSFPSEFKIPDISEENNFSFYAQIASLEGIYQICRFIKGRNMLRELNIDKYLNDFYFHVLEAPVNDVIVELNEKINKLFTREEDEIEIVDLEAEEDF